MLLRTQIGQFINRIYRSKTMLWVNGVDVALHNNILTVLHTPKGKLLYATHNIITAAGDVYYAQRGAAETPTNAFTTLYLSAVTWDATHPSKTSNTDNIASVITGGSKVVDATYPRTNDPDVNNTGGGVTVVTWRFSYGKADFASVVNAGAISLAGVTNWGAVAGNSPVLNAYNEAVATNKTLNDTLTVFVNHTFLGV